MSDGPPEGMTLDLIQKKAALARESLAVVKEIAELLTQLGIKRSRAVAFAAELIGFNLAPSDFEGSDVESSEVGISWPGRHSH